jgi:acetoin utilization deacetylase AcuC-like enzyme
VRALADGLDVPIGAVLEGGYDLEALSSSVVATLQTLGAEAVDDPRPVERDALVEAAAATVGRYWAL